MKKEEPRKRLTEEEKAELMAQVMAAAKGRICFPESHAEAKRIAELIFKGKLPPSLVS